MALASQGAGSNRLLEAFCESKILRNLFKLLKCYRLTLDEPDGFLVDQAHRGQSGHVMKPYSASSSNSTCETDLEPEDAGAMLSVPKLGCNILRQILESKQDILVELLDEQCDVIDIMVELLRAYPADIDLVIFILDICRRATLTAFWRSSTRGGSTFWRLRSE